MSTEIAVNQDDRVVTPDITGDDITANLDSLRAVGLLPGILPTSEESPAVEDSSAESTIRGLTDAVKALAQDVSERMNYFGKRLEALETRSTLEASGSAGAPAPNSTSTPAPEVQNGSASTPMHSGSTPWADRPVTEVPNYEETMIWHDDEDGVEGNSSKLFTVSESTNTLLQESFLKGIPNATRR